MIAADITVKSPRTFLPENFELKEWPDIEPYFQELLEREIENPEELKIWLKNRSELEAIVSENLAWRYIRMTCDTSNEELQKAYTYFVSEIQPKIAPYSDKLNKKVMSIPFTAELRQQEGYDIMFRSIEKEIKLFREENIPLFTEIQNLSKEYGAISGAMTVELDGDELTLQQAGVKLQSTDRDLRERVYFKIQNRRFKDHEKLDELFDKLIKLRHQVARNAGFENFRDYKFESMGRFDYTPQDCFDFHESVRQEIVPLLNVFSGKRTEKLNLEVLRPWDKAVDPDNNEPLTPFNGGEDLTAKTIECFSRLDPFLGECLQVMQEIKHLDLESRKGKAPGGYNYPLAETGIPFIFMNATSTLRDMVTILHEGGHAVHSIVTKNLELHDFKHTPSEVAELASMSMELISMDHWDVFFENEEDLKRAKREHLQQVIETLPWVATIDKLQHWLYENATHSVEERKKQWNAIFAEFADTKTNWEGLERFKDYLWQRQLHLYEVPFYYIEYGFAQLGAIAVWKNFKEDNKKGLDGYLNALNLGYTRTIPEIYKAAGIEFNFSQDYIKELIDFVKAELAKLD